MRWSIDDVVSSTFRILPGIPTIFCKFGSFHRWNADLLGDLKFIFLYQSDLGRNFWKIPIWNPNASHIKIINRAYFSIKISYCHRMWVKWTAIKLVILRSSPNFSCIVPVQSPNFRTEKIAHSDNCEGKITKIHSRWNHPHASRFLRKSKPGFLVALKNPLPISTLLKKLENMKRNASLKIGNLPKADRNSLITAGSKTFRSSQIFNIRSTFCLIDSNLKKLKDRMILPHSTPRNV